MHRKPKHYLVHSTSLKFYVLFSFNAMLHIIVLILFILLILFIKNRNVYIRQNRTFSNIFTVDFLTITGNYWQMGKDCTNTLFF